MSKEDRIRAWSERLETRELKQPDSRGLDSLSALERDIVMMVSEGLNNEQIAERLKVGPTVVPLSLFIAMGKLGCADRVDVAQYVRKQARKQKHLPPPRKKSEH